MMRHLIGILFVALTFGTMNEQLLTSTTWLQQHLGSGRITIVEIGDRASYESGHVPGARFVALHDLLVDRDSTPNELPDVTALEKTLRAAGIPNRGRIILYSCDVIAATRAFFTLDYLGQGERTALLDGGYAKWIQQGRPIAAGPPPPASGNFAALPHPEAVVRLNALRAVLHQPEIQPGRLAIIDARPPNSSAARPARTSPLAATFRRQSTSRGR